MKLQLTNNEREFLEKIRTDPDAPSLHAQRARTILLLETGMRICKVAKDVGVREPFVYQTRAEFAAYRLDAIAFPASTCNSKDQKIQLPSNDQWVKDLASYGLEDIDIRFFFQEYGPLRLVYDNLNVEIFDPLFSDHGRSPTTVRPLLMVPILMSFTGFSFVQLANSFRHQVGLRFVLGIPAGERVPISSSNYYRFLNRLEDYHKENGIYLADKVLEDLVSKMAPDMGFCLENAPDGYVLKTRLDSQMISMHARHLSRTGIVYQCNQDAVLLLKSCGMELPANLYHYLKADDKNRVIYHNQGKMMDKMYTLMCESTQIRDLMRGDKWKTFAAYQNLDRCISDQATIGEGGTITIKASQDILGSSLQTPRDPYATSRTKNGKNYQGEVGFFTEAYDSEGHSLVIRVGFERNILSDAEYLNRVVRERELNPNATMEECVSDGAFFSMEAFKRGLESGFFHIPTALTGVATNPLFSEFELSSDGKTLISCPNGTRPFSQYTTPDGMINAKFSHSDCSGCPFAGKCPCKKQVRANKVLINQETVIRADILNSFGSEEFKVYSDKRNGCESIPSILNNRYRVQKIRSSRTTVRRLMYFSAVICLNARKYRDFKNSVNSTLFTYEAKAA